MLTTEMCLCYSTACEVYEIHTLGIIQHFLKDLRF